MRACAGVQSLVSKRKLVEVLGAKESRAEAAVILIEKVRTLSDELRKIVFDGELLWTAYIEIAKHELPSETSLKMSHAFDPRWSIRKLKNLCISVATKTLPLLPLAELKDTITTVAGFEDDYKIVGGINLPKIIECRGSNGEIYKQLVKGRDDVRQV
jgi:ataxia telangiectasia mutated family protein